MSIMSSGSALMTPQELAEYLRKPVGTLRQWRCLRIGPAFVKVGRDVRYRRSDVEQWLNEQARA
jgi:excisionase family DNA binding protein